MRRRNLRRPVTAEAARLAAIRTVTDLAVDTEDHDVAAEALLALGATEQEITAATLG